MAPLPSLSTASPFDLKFLNNLDRWDIEDLVEVSFLDNEIHVRHEPGEDWTEVASLRDQHVYHEFMHPGSQLDYGYKIIRVSDGQAGVGRFQLDGIQLDPDGQEIRHVIWDDVECVQGDRDGLFVYARGRGRGFHLDWLAEECGWQYRDGRLGEPPPERSGPVFSEIRLFRHKPANSRTRPSALAG